MKNKNMKFSNIIKGMILEQGRYEILKKTYTEPKGKGEEKQPAAMTVDELDKIVLGDPTTRSEGDNIKKAGTYTNWLVKQFLKLKPDAEIDTPRYKAELQELKRLFFEDLYKTTEDLKKFERFKGQLEITQRDINSHTIDSLERAVEEFSLEKTKTTKDERAAAAVTYEHPGGEVIFKGKNWTVVKIENQGKLGQDAACFYGGYDLKPIKGETGWCTSSPGGGQFNYYIKQGPLYVIIPNQPKSFNRDNITAGEKSGLPADRYQFHFPSNQFKGSDDREIDLLSFLNENPEIKEVFKPEFMKNLTKDGGKTVSVEYPKDQASRVIAIYGFDEFFDTLPDDLDRLDFIKSSDSKNKEGMTYLELPKSIGRFKNLHALHLEGIVKEIPKEVAELKNLRFLSLPDNPELKEIPKEIFNLPELNIINIRKSPNVILPDGIEDRMHIFK
jgi:hypothetical protein